MSVIAITGAAGSIGRSLVPLLARPDRELRLFDLELPDDAETWTGSWLRGSVSDREALLRAFAGADAVVHLAGLASERPWSDILATNIDGGQSVLESAHRAGATRVLLASSIHSLGYWTADDLTAVANPGIRPDTYYGVSKVALEALGSVFADRFGMTVVSARICTFLREPGAGRTVATWLSPADMARLAEAAIALDEPGHHVVWGVSANAPDWFPLEAGHRIGYHPQDDAARWLAERDGRAPEWPDGSAPLSGVFIDGEHPLGVRYGTAQAEPR